MAILLWVIAIPIVLSALVIVFGFYYRTFVTGMATTTAKMIGKTVIITGSSAGIGKEAARDIARRGARVILACRNMEKASKVAADIQSSTGNKDVFVRKLDTSSLASVRSFASEILSEEKKIDVLVLNAGTGGTDDICLTPEGFELTMATNHFGHFLLANLLLGRLKESSPSRIVITASIAHANVKGLNTKDLNYKDGGFGSMEAYSRSKLCNILVCRRLSEILSGTGVVANSLCPGLVASEIFDKSGGIIIGQILRLLAPFIAKSEHQGAQTIIHLAASEEAAEVSGQFFEDCKISKTDTPLSKDSGLAKKLWEVSESLVQLQSGERHY